MGQATLQLLELLGRELLRPAGLLDVEGGVALLDELGGHDAGHVGDEEEVDLGYAVSLSLNGHIKVNRLYLEDVELGPDDGMEAVEDGGVVEAAHIEGGDP